MDFGKGGAEKLFTLRFMVIKQLLYFGLLFLLPLSALKSQPDGMELKDELFRLSREHDTHEIIYYLNPDKRGNLDQNEPIEAYWIRYEFDGSTTGRALNVLESKYAYGLKFYEVTERSARLQFVSYERDLFLERIANEFVVLVEIRGKEVRLERVHLHIGKGSFWVPTISRIELHAVDPETGKAVVEVINNP